MRLKSCLAACAVASLTISAASAKDLPRREPEPRSTGCEWAGPGFAKLPGSDTCVKVGGSVRVEAGVSSAGPTYVPFGK